MSDYIRQGLSSSSASSSTAAANPLAARTISAIPSRNTAITLSSPSSSMVAGASSLQQMLLPNPSELASFSNATTSFRGSVSMTLPRKTNGPNSDLMNSEVEPSAAAVVSGNTGASVAGSRRGRKPNAGKSTSAANSKGAAKDEDSSSTAKISFEALQAIKMVQDPLKALKETFSSRGGGASGGAGGAAGGGGSTATGGSASSSGAAAAAAGARVSEEDMRPVDRTIHPSGIRPILQNIVATVNLDCRLDLKHIALQAKNAEYNPKRFAAVIMRIREPKTTALIFASGKMVVTGAKSEDQSRLAARKYARIVQKIGFRARFTDFKIQNIVGSCDIQFPIRLEGLAYAHGQFSSYEPELFPGLIYRMLKPKIVLLIFVSGKIVLTGAKVRQDIYDAFEKIFPVLSSFKKKN